MFYEKKNKKTCKKVWILIWKVVYLIIIKQNNKTMKDLIRFDRHANMNGETRREILEIIGDLILVDGLKSRFSVENSMYGLFDGYYYQKNVAKYIAELKTLNSQLADRIQRVIDEVETYPEGETQIF